MPRYVALTEAASTLARANRVLVIGCSGGGKTTLSQSIATTFGLEFQSLDRDVRWLPGWRERAREEQRALIAELTQRSRWIMDGSGASSFDLRLPRTDLVLWVRVPRRVALFGLARRVARFYGSVRPAMAPGCPERLPDREFLSYIWSFERKYAPIFIQSIDRHDPDVPVAVLSSHREMTQLLRMSSKFEFGPIKPDRLEETF
ncbi:AAA family ATPase [Rhizobium sp. Root1203]|uniref:AAA family ATPase n=1 Tax=Rhizobium sp. Root1203 TaxID=1736427 RepID=UPI0007103E1C|nr:AAA family ATPase [Rhizobium sp. Root1203]KQV15910.1 AAA family ATPase [Rhizobium sp. Root1203]